MRQNYGRNLPETSCNRPPTTGRTAVVSASRNASTFLIGGWTPCILYTRTDIYELKVKLALRMPVGIVRARVACFSNHDEPLECDRGVSKSMRHIAQLEAAERCHAVEIGTDE